MSISQRECLCGHILREDPPAAASRFDYGAVLPLIPIVAFLLTICWIATVSAAAHPGTKLLKLAGLTAISSALFVMLDAERLSNSAPASSRLNFSAPTWFIFTLLLWPVAFPLYLYASYARLSPLRMQLGWFSAGVFVIGWLVVWAIRSTAPVVALPKPIPARTTPVLVALQSAAPAATATPVVTAAPVAEPISSLPVITPVPVEDDTTTGDPLPGIAAPVVTAAPVAAITPPQRQRPPSGGPGGAPPVPQRNSSPVYGLSRLPRKGS